MRSAHWGCLFLELLVLHAVIGYAWGLCSGFTALSIILGAAVVLCLLNSVAESGSDYFTLQLAIRDTGEIPKRLSEPNPEQIVAATWAYAAEQYLSGHPIEPSENPALIYEILKFSGRLDDQGSLTALSRDLEPRLDKAA